MSNEKAPSLGAVLLRRWRAERGQTEAARLIDVDQARYSQWERGVRKPGRTAAANIQEVTHGAVQVLAWDLEAPPEAAPAALEPPEAA